MAYVATPADILKVRMEVSDTEAGLYILPDVTYEYILNKNSGSIARSSVDAARMILMRLSITAQDQVVDVLSIKTSKQAEAYRQALILFIKDPTLNPLYSTATVWAGNVSVSEIQANNENIDNNIPTLATCSLENNTTSTSSPFSI